jgi:hypothetical protein
MRGSVRGPRFETLLGIELVGEVNIRFTVQQITKIYSRALQMDSVDLEITPIERPVRIVMINLAVTPRVFSPLDCQRSAARRTEFVASVLLIRGQPVAGLVGLSLSRLRRGPGRYHHWPLESNAQRRSETDCVFGLYYECSHAKNRRQWEKQSKGSQ